MVRVSSAAASASDGGACSPGSCEHDCEHDCMVADDLAKLAELLHDA